MAKIIKSDVPRPSAASARPALAERKIIDREVFDARQRAEELLAQGEQRIASLRAEGERAVQAERARALAHGRSAARIEVAATLLEGYRARARALVGAVDQVLAIAQRMCAKITGEPSAIAQPLARALAVERMQDIVAEHRLLIGMCAAAMCANEPEVAALCARLRQIPEFELLAADDLPPDRVRVGRGSNQVEIDLADLGRLLTGNTGHRHTETRTP
jgi:hypothetical protein